MKIHLSIALLCTLSAAARGQVSVFEGRPGEPGNVVVVLQAQLRPAQLQGIVLLPLDCTGRTRLTELLEGQARLRTDVPGAARLLLPGERGSLYKFRRAEASGGASFGFFLVRPGGMATALFELPGTGPSGTDDPFPGNLALDSSGKAFLIASSPKAGGDLWEVQLVGLAINRTAHIAPCDFQRNGLALLDTWGAGVASDGVQRFERVLGGLTSSVTLPLVPAWFGPDVVHSADGSTVAFLAGSDATRARVLTFRRFSDASFASDSAMPIPGAGFLPEEPNGPALALSADGSWVAWRAEGSISHEVFARETRPTARPPRLHVTGDANFHYTLNDTGVIAFFDHDSLVLFVGQGTTTDGIARGDLFRVDLAPTVVTASNLSLTSGDIQVPFDYGTLNTSDGLYQVPDATPAFVLRDGNLAGRLLWVDTAGRAAEFLDRVASLDSLDVAGTYLVAGVTRPPGVDDPLESTLNLVQIPSGGLGATVLSLPDGCYLNRTASSRTHNVFAAVLQYTSSGERMGRLHVPSSTPIQVSPILLTFGPTTGLTPDGAILATVQLARERAAFEWSDQGADVLSVMRTEAFLLPGL